MKFFNCILINIILLMAFTIPVESKELLDMNLSEEKKVEVKLHDLSGKKISVIEMNDALPEVALVWFFEEVKLALEMDFSPLIVEQKNPISLARWNKNRFHRVSLIAGKQDAAEVFKLIFEQCQWHWIYSEDGQIIIHAWHRGDTER